MPEKIEYEKTIEPDDSPNGLELPRPPKSASRKTYNAIIFVLGLLVLIILWSFFDAGDDEKKKQREETSAREAVESRNFMPGEEAGRGLATGVFPDGSSVTLGAMPGADMGGQAGFYDQVDNHYLRIFGSAVLMSLITGGMSYAMDKVDNNNNSNSDSTSMQDEMASALAAQMGQTTLKILEKNLSLKPTLGIRPGYRFNIVLTKDVIFKGPYYAARR